MCPEHKGCADFRVRKTLAGKKAAFGVLMTARECLAMAK